MASRVQLRSQAQPTQGANRRFNGPGHLFFLSVHRAVPRNVVQAAAIQEFLWRFHVKAVTFSATYCPPCAFGHAPRQFCASAVAVTRAGSKRRPMLPPGKPARRPVPGGTDSTWLTATKTRASGPAGLAILTPACSHGQGQDAQG